MSSSFWRCASTSALHDVVIVSAARTPIGCIGGALQSLSTPQLGAVAISAAISRAKVAPADVDEVFMGNVISAGMGQAPARQAAILAGLPNTVPCSTINKVCSSGLKSIMFAAQGIALGDAQCIVAGGMESMSNVPYYAARARSGYRYGDGVLADGILCDGLTDAYPPKVHMGLFAEKTAEKYNIGRSDQDTFAIESYRRALASAEAGSFAEEIAPVTIPAKRKGKKDTVVSVDEEPTKVNFDRVPTLRPAFLPTGTVTAANASSLNDGAAAVVLMSRERATSLGLTPIARVVGYADAAHDPAWFTTAPQLVVNKLLQKYGMGITDIDYWEINEAFAVVALANMQLLGIDPARCNVFGGATALGHPIGCSGARIVTTLLSVLKQKDGNIGVAAICNGGGGASAMLIERV